QCLRRTPLVGRSIGPGLCAPIPRWQSTKALAASMTLRTSLVLPTNPVLAADERRRTQIKKRIIISVHRRLSAVYLLFLEHHVDRTAAATGDIELQITARNRALEFLSNLVPVEFAHDFEHHIAAVNHAFGDLDRAAAAALHRPRQLFASCL